MDQPTWEAQRRGETAREPALAMLERARLDPPEPCEDRAFLPAHRGFQFPFCRSYNPALRARGDGSPARVRMREGRVCKQRVRAVSTETLEFTAGRSEGSTRSSA